MSAAREIPAPDASALDVVVVGNVGIDTNVYHPAGDIDFSVEANFTDNRDCVGHAGGYSSRGFARLGLRTAFVGHVGAGSGGDVGSDFGGDFVRRSLEGDGIDISALGTDPAGTARSINMMFADGSRKNFYDGKGHMELDPPDGADAVLERCAGYNRAGHGRPGLALFHLANWARRLLPAARRAGLRIACDLQDVRQVDDPYRRDFVHHADVLFFSGANHGDAEELMAAFLELARADGRPDRLHVQGLGGRGCMVGRHEGGEPIVERFPALDSARAEGLGFGPVVDTNGAGDALAVGFLDAWHFQELPIERAIPRAILRGQLAARHTCALKADSSRLITRGELERLEKRMDRPRDDQ